MRLEAWKTRGAVLVLVVVAAGWFGHPALAQDLNGFVPAAGEGDLALGATTESYDHFWLGTRRVADPGLGEVETRSLSLWGQYGLTDHLSVVANLAYVDADSNGLAGFAEASLQDLSVLLRYRALRYQASGGTVSKLVLAAGLRTPARNYTADAPVSPGDGTTDALARVVYQLERGAFYFSQQVGYDARGGDAPDGYPFYSELGFTARRVTTTAFYQRYIAAGGTDIGEPGFTFPSNQEESTRVGAKVFVRLGSGLGVAAGGFTSLDGRNTGDATGYFLAAVFHFGR